MEYRKLPHGDERLGVLGLGTGGFVNTSPRDIQAIFESAIGHGVNFFDLCAGSDVVFAPFGRAISGARSKVHFQLHFGAVYRNGEYGWSRNLQQIERTFGRQMDRLGTDYVDFGFLHCVDELSDWQQLVQNGIVDYVLRLKQQGVVRHIGFSSHTPQVCNAVLDSGLADMMMFSLNPAYDLEQGDEYGIGSTSERAQLLRRAQAMGVGVSVMKPFHGGQLLRADSSPFKQALTVAQCLQYCLDRPAVLSVVPGVSSLGELDELLAFCNATDAERDYSAIGAFTPVQALGNCVYCNHCQPCPAHIDVGLVNKYYDLAQAGDVIAADHYTKLTVKANACIGCGHCNRRCPFKVDQQGKMRRIAAYFDK